MPYFSADHVSKVFAHDGGEWKYVINLAASTKYSQGKEVRLLFLFGFFFYFFSGAGLDPKRASTPPPPIFDLIGL